MIKVPKKTSSTLLRSSIDFLKLGWAWNGATQKYLVQQALGSKKDCSRPPEKKRLEIEAFLLIFFNLDFLL